VLDARAEARPIVHRRSLERLPKGNFEKGLREKVTALTRGWGECEALRKNAWHLREDPEKGSLSTLGVVSRRTVDGAGTGGKVSESHDPQDGSVAGSP
jgi:hypothetical protein